MPVMPGENELYRVAVYFDDDHERQQIEEALTATSGGHVQIYNGKIAGVATPDTCTQLSDAGLAVSVLGLASADDVENQAPEEAADVAVLACPRRTCRSR
jgi:hypothetical protein